MIVWKNLTTFFFCSYIMSTIFPKMNAMIRSTVAGRNTLLDNIFVPNSEGIIISTQSRSNILCLASCLEYCSCRSVVYNIHDRSCFGLDRTLFNTADSFTDNGWKYTELRFGENTLNKYKI